MERDRFSCFLFESPTSAVAFFLLYALRPSVLFFSAVTNGRNDRLFLFIAHLDAIFRFRGEMNSQQVQNMWKIIVDPTSCSGLSHFHIQRSPLIIVKERKDTCSFHSVQQYIYCTLKGLTKRDRLQAHAAKNHLESVSNTFHTQVNHKHLSFLPEPIKVSIAHTHTRRRPDFVV